MTFVNVDDGWIRLDSVARYKRDSKSGDKVILKDGTTVKAPDDFFDAVISLVTPQGEWECVIANSWDGDRLSEIIEPVLAWGLAIDGYVIPITPLYPKGVIDLYALRRAGSEMVYSGAEGPLTVAQFLDRETKSAQRLGKAPGPDAFTAKSK